MEFLTLNNGVKMPILGLGTWDLRGDECIRVVSEAIELGYRLIDTAQMYENEAEVGKGIAKSNIDRSELFITTKLDERSNGYQEAKDGIKSSLENLGLDYIDLIILHRPYSHDLEMYKALIEANEAGLVRAIGISNYNQERYDEFLKHCQVVPQLNQIEAHLFFQKWDFQKHLQEQGTVFQAWSPLTQGLVDPNSQQILKELSEEYGKTPAQVTLRFFIQRGISVAPKTSRVERLKENIDVFDFVISDEDIEKIKKIDTNKTLFPWTEEW